MKKKWETRTLSEIAKIQSGSGFPEKYQGKIGLEYPFYKVSDMNLSGNEEEMIYENNSISEKMRIELRAPVFPKGSIIFPKIGGAIATNKKRLVTKNSCVDNNVMGVITNSEIIDNRYFYYYFLQVNLMDFSNKAGLPSIKKSVLENWQVSFPTSLPEQQRIVSLLDETFAGLAQVHANAERNLVNAREVFEAVLEDSLNNDIWEEKRLDEICEVKDGTHDTPKYVDDGIPFVTQKNIREEGLSFDDTKFIDLSDHEKYYKRSNVFLGDILISMIGANRGMACIVDDKRVFSIKNVGLIKSSENINQSYLLYFLKSPRAKKYISENSKGGAQEFIGLTELRKFPILIPPLEEQRAIVERLDGLAAETSRLEAVYQSKLEAVEELRKSVLGKAFAGGL